ncbi:terminase [uncultured Alistipes sp.]|uniref:terminase n=1 Tax=uncultured Alistipes sp. TaxID=538949 RepID=UPI002665698D|nr:terminase [uncultured Alistipes sp.]
MIDAIREILRENERRNAEIHAPFNPYTGEGAVGERRKVAIDDFPIRTQYLPVGMLQVPLVAKLIKAGSIEKFTINVLNSEYSETERMKVIEQFVRVRIRYDFCFWAAMFVYIKNKGGGDDVLFKLTRPQRRFVARLEELRLAGKPIRIILLKARQWGGSTVSQLYMAWLMLVHKVGLNSLIIAHQGTATDEIKDMFDRMIKRYPVGLLYELGASYDNNEPKMVAVGKSGAIFRVPQRNCKVKLGTAERPDSCRGGDYNLVHCSEVGIWKKTDGKSPEDIVRSACSGILLEPYTMIVYESTANGTGNFFQREYDAAKRGQSQFEAMFVSWFDIEKYSMPIDDLVAFAIHLYENRNNENENSTREESGRYLWWLWNMGATLEGINWYIKERAKYNDHGQMASEYPSDDIEAFVHSGARVFDKYKVEALRPACRPPRYIGDVYADADEGEDALRNIRFAEDHQGMLWIWALPEIDEQVEIANRYLTIVDIGGRWKKADWSVIVVFDRLFMMDGGKPSVVAQWYGHIDMDRLAWKAAQIAAFYDNALLVIESNTAETKDKNRNVDGDQSFYILNQIKGVYNNMYARKQSEDDIINKVPRKYGFHTNVSTKPMIISTLVKVVREAMYVERDVRCLDEYITYEKVGSSFGAIPGKHDDLLMTRAIGMHICFYEMDMPTECKRILGIHRHVKNRAISEATI